MLRLTHEAAGAALVLLGVGGVLFAAARLRRRGVEPELTRKLAHVGTALAALPLPWVVRSVATIPVLVAVAALGLWALRRSGKLGFLDDVKRSHASEYWYVLALAVAWVVSGDDRALWLTAVLVLGISDALAAVVGRRFGRHRYTVAGATRSLEGSLACAVSAGAVCAAVQLFATGSVSVPRALLVGVAVALVEAVSLAGSDNFTVPLAALGASCVTVDLAQRAAMLVAPVAVAGVVHQLVRRREAWPWLKVSLDVALFGGREVFGRNKTLRGFVVMPLACGVAFALERAVLGAPLLALPAWAGVLIGFCYVLFELPNSYLKRRLGIAPGQASTPAFFVADHLDSALGCALAFGLLFQPLPVVVTGLVLAPLLHVALNLLSHAARVRSSPW